MMVYKVQQLQALDFLLKRITAEKDYPVFNKNLKLVIELNNSYWYGDFVVIDGFYPSQLSIDDFGDVEKESFSPSGSNATTTLAKIWKSYTGSASSKNHTFYVQSL